jgi:hypothetical protein
VAQMDGDGLRGHGVAVGAAADMLHAPAARRLTTGNRRMAFSAPDCSL